NRGNIMMYYNKCNYIEPSLTCTSCNSYIMMYIDNNIKIISNNLQTLEKENLYIDHMFHSLTFLPYTLDSDNNILEIYIGGCEKDMYNIELMIYTLVTEIKSDIVYIIINPDFNYFNNIITYIVTNGFSNAKLINSSHLNKNLPHTVISLELDKNDYMIDNGQIDVSYELRDRYFNAKNTCVFKIYIPLSLTKKLHDYIYKNVEYGGSLVITSYKIVTEGKQKYPQATLSLNNNSETSGTITGVNPPISMFTFHCHPIVAYQQEKTNIGWPSHTD